MEHLVVSDHDGWAALMLSRPSARNALNTALLYEIASTLDSLAQDTSCRAVLVAGAEGNFAAGADITEIEHKGSAEGAADPRKQMWARIRAFPKPMIAAVEGFALGGGFELALMADLLVAGDSAKFGLPETSLALIPGAGGGQRVLARCGPARAARLVLLGEIIDADTAYDWGLASHRATEARPLAEKLVAQLASRAPLALAAAKRSLVRGAEAGLALTEERDGFERLLDSADKSEGIAAFRERRKAEFSGK